LALAIALAYFILVGGTNLGTYVVSVAALNGAVAGALVALWLVELPRSNDISDRLLLIALLAFLATCVTSAFPRMSFEAATSVTATVAAFGIARGELVSSRAERAMITVLAICGSVLAIGFLATWIPQWIDWWRVTATLPPLDLPLQPGPYRHYHIAAMLLVLLLPALLQVRQRKSLGAFAWAAVTASLAAIYMSGSRTAWIALVAVGAVALAMRLRLRPAVIAGGVAVAGGLGALAYSGALGSTISRLLNTVTLALRAETWSSALGTWLERPLTGWGPGSFPAVFRFQQDLPVYPDPGGHAHNVIVQILLEGGLLGFGSLVVVIVALAIGISANRSRSPYALMGLALFGLMSFADLPGNFPMVLVIGISWAALAAPRVSHAPFAASPPRIWYLAASGTLGAIIVVGVASTLIAWAAFGDARARLGDGDLAAARQALDRSVTFDPSMALYWRERGTRAAEAGDDQEAQRDLRRALQLNRGDTATLRALAVLTLDEGPDDAVAFARRAAALHGTQLDNQLILAWVAGQAGDEGLAERALADALTWYPWAAAAPTWPVVFERGVDDPLRQAADAWSSHDREGSWEATWLRAMAGTEPVAGLGPSLAAVHAVIGCDPTQAATLLAGAGTGANDQLGLTARLMLAALTDDNDAHRAAIAVTILRGSQLANLASRDPGPASPFSDYAQDVGLYRRIPLPAAHVEPMLPTQGEGLAAWLQDPQAAASRAAPASGLAECGG
jgi:O-antigen ligase